MGWENTFVRDPVFFSFDCLRALDEAFYERRLAAYGTDSTVYNRVYDFFPAFQTPHGTSSGFAAASGWTWCCLIDTMIGELIPRFVNHTLPGTAGRPEKLPAWTAAELYAYLGEERILLVNERFSPELRRDWALQIYRVLNLLLWTDDSSRRGTWGEQNRSVYSQNQSGPNAFYDDCVSRWAAESSTLYVANPSISSGRSPNCCSTSFSCSSPGTWVLNRGRLGYVIRDASLPRRELPAGALEMPLKFLDPMADYSSLRRDWIDLWPFGAVGKGDLLYWHPTVTYDVESDAHYFEAQLPFVPREAVTAYAAASPYVQYDGLVFICRHFGTVVTRHEATGQYQYYDPEEVWRRTQTDR